MNYLSKKKIFIQNYIKIKQKGDIQVGRAQLSFSNGKKRRVVIKKEILPKGIDLSNFNYHPSLQKERLVYQFLMQQRNDFSLFPELLAFFPGTLIIEDLGIDDFSFPDEVSAQSSVLNTLAKLHAVSSGKEGIFSELEEQNPISLKGYRILPYQPYKHTFLNFREGLDYCKKQCSDSKLGNDRCKKEQEEIFDKIKNPAIFHCLIHNDFISRRQSIVKEGQFFLLDFEHAEFSHALLDVFRLYIGKYEFNLKDACFFRKRSPYTLGIEEVYKKQFETSLKYRVEEEVWGRHISATVLFLALGIIGQLQRLPSYFMKYNFQLYPEVSHNEDLTSLLQTVKCILNNNNNFPYIKDLIFKSVPVPISKDCQK